MGLSGGALVFSAAAPALKAFLLTATGAVFANPRINVLNPRMLRDFNTLIIWLFTPSLIFLNISSAVSISNIQTLWPLPFNVILQVIIGRILGGLVILVFRPPVEYRPIVLGAVAVGNLGNLPLSLLETFCSNSQNEDFGGDECSQVGQGYVALGIIPAVIVQWTWLYDITAPRPAIVQSRSPAGPALPEFVDAERTTLLGQLNENGGEENKDTGNGELEEIKSECSGNLAQNQSAKNEKTVVEAFEMESPGSPAAPAVISCRPLYAKRGLLADFISTARNNSPAHHISSLLKRPEVYALGERLKRVLTPPCISAFTAIVIGLIPSAKRMVLDDSSPLRIIRQTIEGFGNCTIPSIMLLLGAKLSKGPGNGTRNMGLSVVWATVITRLIIVPAIGMLLVRAYVLFGLLPKEDRLQKLVLHIQHAMPTAVNMVSILTMHNYGEEELSAIVFWEYCLCVFTISFWFSLFLYF